MKQFEYTVVNLSNLAITERVKQMNDLGNEGWQLVAIDNGDLYFRKEINHFII